MKATGLDCLSAKILKTSADSVAPSLLKVVNISLLQSRFPKSLTIAKINLIHKGSQKSDPSNYRPISVLPILSEVIEKHVTNHLFAYLNKYNIFTLQETLLEFRSVEKGDSENRGCRELVAGMPRQKSIKKGKKSCSFSSISSTL